MQSRRVQDSGDARGILAVQRERHAPRAAAVAGPALRSPGMRPQPRSSPSRQSASRRRGDSGRVQRSGRSACGPSSSELPPVPPSRTGRSSTPARTSSRPTPGAPTGPLCPEQATSAAPVRSQPSARWPAVCAASTSAGRPGAGRSRRLRPQAGGGEGIQGQLPARAASPIAQGPPDRIGLKGPQSTGRASAPSSPPRARGRASAHPAVKTSLAGSATPRSSAKPTRASDTIRAPAPARRWAPRPGGLLRHPATA